MLAIASEPLLRLDAEEIAVAAMAFIASHRNEAQDFLSVTGLEPHTIRRAAQTPQFLAGVLDYVVADDQVLRRVTRAIGWSEDAIHTARRELLPSAATSTMLDPADFGPGPLDLHCEHCRKRVRRLDRRQHANVPAAVRTISTPRCGDCGGGFDQPEAWLNVEGCEVGP